MRSEEIGGGVEFETDKILWILLQIKYVDPRRHGNRVIFIYSPNACNSVFIFNSARFSDWQPVTPDLTCVLPIGYASRPPVNMFV